MGKTNIVLLILSFALWSCVENQDNIESISSTPKGAIYPYSKYEFDTIQEGQLIKAKIFLSSDSLYQIARKNGISEYLRIMYWDGDTVNIKADIANLKGDTGLVSFYPVIPNLPKGGSTYYTWQYRFEIDFDPKISGIDTIFSVKEIIYIKSIE